MPGAKASDKPYIWLVRRPQGLVGYSEYDRDLVERYRIGSHIICTLEQPRDPVMNKKFHGLIGDVAKGIGVDREWLKTVIMAKAGCVRAFEFLEGFGMSVQPRSLTELEQPDMEELYWRTVEIVITDYLPHITAPDLIERINRYIGVTA